jgi:hypothetical protein
MISTDDITNIDLCDKLALTAFSRDFRNCSEFKNRDLTKTLISTAYKFTLIKYIALHFVKLGINHFELATQTGI